MNYIIISFIILFIVTILVILTVLYFLYWKPTNPTVPCQDNNNCTSNQFCQGGICTEISCSTDANCNGTDICINSYCTPYQCQIGNDCPTEAACISNQCLETNTICNTNNDCFGLPCLNQICAQCLVDSDCPTGQGCFSLACRYPYSGETSAGLINYPSLAQSNGNISAPPGYFCSTSTCSNDNQNPISCGSGQLCLSNCSYCVNSVCRCTPGVTTELCVNNTDCASLICNNGICSNNTECLYNYNGSGVTGYCQISKPYCVNGLCSNLSEGAVCGATGLPSDLCNNPQSLGVPGVTGISPNGMGFFCVNGICQQNPGLLNNLCTVGSCQFISTGILTCQAVETPSIPQMRCLVAS